MREGLARAGQALLQLYPKGISLFWLAPLVLALAVIPEFIQHVVEIRLGMFDSREAFRALADDPARMAFGFAKIAGLLLAILATPRFWWRRGGGGASLVRPQGNCMASAGNRLFLLHADPLDSGVFQ